MNKRECEELDMALMSGIMKGCLSAVVFWVVLLALLLCFVGCKSVKYVPVIEHRTDTLIISKHQRDSIWLHDSVHVTEKQKGDTVYLMHDRWHTKYVESIFRDTTYVSKIDSVPQPYPVEVKVPRELTWWQTFKMRAGVIALAMLFGWIVFQVWKIYNHRF